MVATSDHAVTRAALRRLIRAIEQRPAPVAPRTRPLARPLEEALGAGWERRSGGVLRRETTLPAEQPHGSGSLGDLRWAEGPVLAALGADEGLVGCSADDLLFLDVESTGLGGSGAVVFLVTTGRWLGSGFLLRQYFAPSPAAEDALIALLSTDCGVADERPLLATYNGTTFDAPLLDQRAVMHRQRGGYEALPQLDLLRAVRHGFRATLPSHRLGVAEWSLLGVTRPEDEVSGGDVPTWYFRYLRSGDHRHLLPLIAHNTVDVVSLAALTGRMAAVMAGRGHPSGIESLAAGRIWMQAKRDAEASTFLSDAVRTLPDGWARDDAMLALASIYKRCGRLDEAARLWSEVGERGNGCRLRALVELAKYYEHGLRDPVAALASVERAILIAGATPALTWRRDRLLRQGDRTPIAVGRHAERVPL